MIFPPSILRVRIVESGRRKLSLLLPLFMLWPLAVVLWLLALPILLLAAAVRWRLARPLLIGPVRMFVIFCRLRGLRLEVSGPKDEVIVRMF